MRPLDLLDVTSEGYVDEKRGRKPIALKLAIAMKKGSFFFPKAYKYHCSSPKRPSPTTRVTTTSAAAAMSSTRWGYTYDNPIWATVDTYTMSHMHPPSRPNTKLLQSTLTTCTRASLPPYALSAPQAKFLALHLHTSGVTHALEIGTLGGYTALWLATSNPGLHVTTIEFNEHHAAIARQNIEKAGLSSRIELLEGAALGILPRLRAEVQSGTRPKFGFVFIDADKKNNWAYFQAAREMVLPRGVICVDNVVRDGDLVDERSRDESVRGSREVVERVGELEGVDAVVLQMVGEKGYDGWLWAVVER